MAPKKKAEEPPPEPVEEPPEVEEEKPEGALGWLPEVARPLCTPGLDGVVGGRTFGVE